MHYRYDNVFAALETGICRAFKNLEHADELLRKYYWFAVLPQVRFRRR
jgi:hypothetical protein